MKSFYFAILLIILSCGKVLGQDIQTLVKQAYSLVDDEKYNEALKVLRDIDERNIEISEDSCAMTFYYAKGSSLYFLDRFEEAIPYLNKALLRIEKLPHEDCVYLELIYGIGSCYNNLKQYHNAEKYFRRVIIRGKSLDFECMITTQTLSELTEVYNKLGYSKLAEECTDKIILEKDNLPYRDLSDRTRVLFDLAESYNNQGKYDEEIEIYYNILDLIESNIGNKNDDYLVYANVLSYKLFSLNRQEEAIKILKKIIDIGRSYKVHSKYVCYAYEDHLRTMAKQNQADLVESMIQEAVDYIKHTKDYDWQKSNLYEKIGNAFADAGNYKLGIKYLEKPWNGNSSNNIQSLVNLGFCYYFKPDYQKSIFYLKKAEKMISNSTDNVTRKVIYYYLYTAYNNSRNYVEAIKYAELVAPYIKEIDGNDAYAQHLILWAIDCGNASQFFEAQRLFDEAKNILSIVSDSTKVAYYSQYGFYFLMTNESYKAIDVLKDGIKICIETLEEDYALLTTMYHNLGRAYMFQKDFANALLYLNKSKDLQIKLNGKAMQRTLDYIKECNSK